MSVKRVLNTPELLHTVLAAANPTTLARVARVARFFTDSALDALWRILPSSIHLLRLLPSFRRVNFRDSYVSVGHLRNATSYEIHIHRT